MIIYHCVCCDYSTNIKCNYNKHLESNKHKVNKSGGQKRNKKVQKGTIWHKKEHKTTNSVYDVKCKYCNKSFTTVKSMNRHIKYSCKENKDEDFKELARLLNEFKEESIKKDKEIEKMTRQIERLTNKLQIQNVTNNMNSHNQYNIKILNYNKTDYSHLTENDYMKCIADCNKCVKTMIEKVHFNKDKPENMNIYISSIKGNYVMMFKDNQWQIVNRKESIDDIFDKNEFEIETWYEEYKDKYPHIIKSFNTYLKNKEEDDAMLNDVKDEIMVMLYNKRTMIDGIV